ncbi:MAG TPA: TonB-dependent receptor [Blastocatellia bacterium]|nr:TonB-dependent receptor [Blastocatellia bacterium]
MFGSKRRRILQKGLVFATTLMLMCGIVVHAQDTTNLSGIVTDPQGKVIQGATVTATNTANGNHRSVTTGDNGAYTFNQLSPGQYNVRVEAHGFKVSVQEGVNLVVRTPASMNFELEVGHVTETVTVSAGETLVNRTDATIGNAFTAPQITQLPLEGRNVAGLLSLQPGVTFIGRVNADGGTTDSRNGSVNGGKSDQANVTLDGVDVNDQQNGLAFNSSLRVTLDSVQEFRVVTTNANAEQGRSSGAQISLVTKGGTNTFHGSAYEFNRNTLFEANDWFNNAVNPEVPRPKLIRNVFGASVGGPIIKDRLFFFANWEARRDSRDASVLRTVPSVDLRNGIVHEVNSAGQIVTLDAAAQVALDPAHKGPNPAVLAIFKQYPVPNDFTTGDGLNAQGFRFNSPIHLHWNTYIARMDYNLTSDGKHSLFWRGSLQNDKDNGVSQFPGQPPLVTNLEHNKGFAAGYNAALTPNLVNVLRAGYTRVAVESAGSSPFSSTHIVSFRGISDLIAAPRSLRQFIPTWNIVDDLSWARGQHSLQFGGNFRWIRTDRLNFATSFFSASLNKAWLQSGRPLRCAGCSSGADLYVADLWGVGFQVNAQYNVGKTGNGFGTLPEGTGIQRNYGANEFEWYGQDSWRVKPNLTLTYGLRYSLYSPPWELNGNQVSPSMNLGDWYNLRGANMIAGRPDTGNTPKIAFALSGPENGGLKSFYDWNKKNFAPRLAFAWSPGGKGFWKHITGGEGKMVIRGGYGMVYDRIGGALAVNAEGGALSFGFSSGLTNPAGVQTVANGARFTGIHDIPASLTLPPPPVSFPATFPDSFAITAGIDDKLKTPYSQSINFSISRELPHDMGLEVAYVGRLARHLLINHDAAMPLDLVDTASGMDYFTAAQILGRLGFANTPTSKIPKIPYWENLFPGYAGGGLTATQAIYDGFYGPNGFAPDFTTSLQAVDARTGGCSPCSRFGHEAFFNAQFSSLGVLRSLGTSNYHSLQVLLRKRFTHRLQFDFNYTFSKSEDITSSLERSGDFQANVLNAWSPTVRKSVSDFDITHQANINGIWELPVGKGQLVAGGAPKWADAIIGGWQLSTIFRITSGLPTSVGNGFFFPTNWEFSGFGTQLTPITNTGVHGNVAVSPADKTKGPNIFADPTAAFAAYQNTLPGGVGTRNLIRGGGFMNLDMGLGKKWAMPWKETHSLQLRWEVFNVTNTVSFDPGGISASLDTPGTFGKYTSTLSSSRVMQVALRYQF